jgi:hypothetical protein
VRHNDLRVSVDRGLCIVALDVAVLGLEDAAFGIGEVALRFRFGCCRRLPTSLQTLMPAPK